MPKAVAAIIAGVLLFGAAKMKPRTSPTQTSVILSEQALEVDGKWLLPATQVAEQAGGSVKLLEDGTLAVVCLAHRCTPIQVDGTRARRQDGVLFVEKDALARALQVAIGYKPPSRTVTIRREQSSPGQGRESFNMEIGQLVPDIEFADLEGKPVRLSDFRGKRLAVFSWASW